ncbi:MAG: N-acetylmuramoyl-L-alanine amidase [Boseongicola sp.]|nr:N-acetylmuramoyl-L-alanine amidase [Boseongicola sp.]
MERLLDISAGIDRGQELSEDDFDFLRNIREILDDLDEIQSGPAPADTAIQPASGPALGIVVGHMKSAQGAFATSPINASEYEWNSHLAGLILAECAARNVEAQVFYRDGVGISGAYKQVDAYGATCVLELHFNAAKGNARGTETLYDGDTNKMSESWANALQVAMVDVYGRTGSADRGLKERDPGDRGYKSLSSSDIPSALIEPFFGDHPGDAHLGHETKKALAAAIAETAATWLLTS